MKRLHCLPDQKKDVISYLPEPIRSHIVSSLPMKDAIRAQILSRRWRNICSSLSKMEFSNGEYGRTPRDFKCFVDKMLIRHDGSDVRKFSLFVPVDDGHISSTDINAWITFAVHHNVQEFKIYFWHSSEKIEALPCCFFTCSSLSSLSVQIDHLWLPTLIEFPVLKRLHLNGVKFSDVNVSKKLFSSHAFPVLEDLLIEYGNFVGISTLSISIASLKFLQLLCHDDIVVSLFTPCLSKVDYACSLPPNISDEILASLVDAYFQFPELDSPLDESTNCRSARELLLGLHNIESLNLSGGFLENLAKDGDLLAHFPACYCSLKELYIDIDPKQNHGQVVTLLLSSSPNLEMLHIEVEEDYGTPSEIILNYENWQSSELSIGHDLKHLKRIEFTYFKGGDVEVDIVKCLLETASILESMNISYSPTIKYNPENNIRVSEKLSSFRRVSPLATMLFSFS